MKLFNSLNIVQATSSLTMLHGKIPDELYKSVVDIFLLLEERTFVALYEFL